MKEQSNKTVIVGMSGGVDSSVSALLLKEQGYRVIGLFMKNWEDDVNDTDCPWKRDYEDVVSVCEKLDIPYYTIDFVKEYWDHVFTDFIDGLKRGVTPNPDILCNREIKFKAFYQKARELGADYLATGHYARRSFEHVPKLLRGIDKNKDQSYFLYTLKSEILRNVLFPLGELTKTQVRELAMSHGLSTSHKKDSTGICFIGERKMQDFLKKYLAPKVGPIKKLNGEVVGEHSGVHNYTIGQRKGLGLGGPGEAWYVVDKDHHCNTLFVERGEHPALYRNFLVATEASFVNDSQGLELDGRELTCKVRYRQHDQVCKLSFIDQNQIMVTFKQPQRALTKGQSVVFYQGEVCLGGAFIEKLGPSLYESDLNLTTTYHH